MNVIIVFRKPDHGKNIRRILAQSGFEVKAVCTAGSKALQHIQELSGGIVVCGHHFTDMMYDELYEYLPPGFEMLLMASAEICDAAHNRDIRCLSMPLRVHELLETMHGMEEELSGKRKREKRKPKVRTKEEEELLLRAKELLMERKNMTEEEAHRYIQKRSMDNGTGLPETSRMILSLMDN